VVGAILLPPPLDSGPFFDQPLVLASSTEDLRSNLYLRGEVEDHRVGASDGDAIPGLRSKLQQPIFYPNPM